MGKGFITQKQQALFEFLQRYLSEHRQAPFIWEIQTGCQIASYKSAVDRLNALERKGFIRRIPNKHRGIKLVKRMLPELQPQAVAAPLPLPPKAHEPEAAVGEVA